MTNHIGQQFGNYCLLRPLGAGSFASVYLGEHQYLERPAAIKVLHERLEPAKHESFRREARTIAQLDHPHIIRVHDFGIEGEIPYLVMEYAQGGTLRSCHPKGTQLSHLQIITYVKQIASALDYAHQQRVIHRDIKPENILLNAKAEVVLSDFGIAVVQPRLSSLSTQHPAGTPLYMAPEQFRGKPCAASDQYALGVMVYEWLCGEPPFCGSLFEIFNQHLHKPPPSVCKRVPQLPPAVEDAVMRALAKDPQQRFASIADFASALGEAFFATQPLLPGSSIQHKAQGQTALPVVHVSPVSVPPLREQEHSDYATQPHIHTVQPIGHEYKPVQSVSPKPVTHSQTPLKQTKHSLTQTNRQRLLRRVRSFWITGVLEQSLHGAALMALGLEVQPDAVANPWHLVLQHPNTVPHPLPVGTRIIQVYDTADGELLILGAPGSGKTTLLLELARDLLERAECDEQCPIPIVFNLSSWVMKRQSLVEWLVEELATKYQVPRKLGRELVEADQLLLLLDGLDEIAIKGRSACIETINTYRQEHGLVPLVVCSRSADYLTQSTRVQLGSAVEIQPLTNQQVENYLTSAGEQGTALRNALRQDAALCELGRTPLMLSILILTYQGKSIEDAIQSTTSLSDRQHQIFEHYVQHMLTRRGAEIRYTHQQTTHWLVWLAKQMKQRNQTLFYIEHLQPDWLSGVLLQRVYVSLAARIPCIVVGILTSFAVFTLLFGLLEPVSTLLCGIAGGLIGYFWSKKHETSPPQREKEHFWSKILISNSHLRNGALVGLSTGLIDGQHGLANGLTFGFLFGILFLLISILLSAILENNRTIQPVEVLVWSWRSLWRSLITPRHVKHALFFGLITGLSAALIDQLRNAMSGHLLIGLTNGLHYNISGGGLNLSIEQINAFIVGPIDLITIGLGAGLSYWLLVGLFHGVSHNMLDDRLFLALRGATTDPRTATEKTVPAFQKMARFVSNK